MKTLICALAALTIAGFAPGLASAADFGGYDDQDDVVIERQTPFVENERIIERRYYEPDEEYYDDAPVVTYYRRPYRYPYYAAYPYGFEPHVHHRRWGHRARW